VLGLLLAPYLQAEVVGGPSDPTGLVLRQLAGGTPGPASGAAAAAGGLLVPVPFSLVLLGERLAALIRGGPGRRGAAVGALVVFAVGKGVSYAEFIRVGRGHHMDALRYTATETAGDLITVDVDHPLHVGTMLSFFARYLKDGKKLDPHGESLSDSLSDWFLTHSDEETPPWPSELTIDGRHRYRLECYCPSKEVYGFDLYVFRRADPGS
jgi:hypothetical protein